MTICEHGNRRVTRLEKNGLLTLLADRFEGKRLNSPNDLVYRSRTKVAGNRVDSLALAASCLRRGAVAYFSLNFAFNLRLD